MPSARLAARMDSLFSFPVGLFHPLQHAGFDPGAPKLDVAGSIPVSRFSFQYVGAVRNPAVSVYFRIAPHPLYMDLRFSQAFTMSCFQTSSNNIPAGR